MDLLNYGPAACIFASFIIHAIYAKEYNISCCQAVKNKKSVLSPPDCDRHSHIKDYRPEGSSKKTPCDFCFSENSFYKPGPPAEVAVKYLKGCGVKSMAKKTFNVEPGYCKIIEIADNNEVLGVDPAPEVDQKVVRCACQNKDDCNKKTPLESYGYDWPEQTKTGPISCCGNKNPINNVQVKELKASLCAKDDTNRFEAESCEKCLIVYDFEAGMFSQGCLTRDMKTTTAKEEFKKYFNSGDKETDHCAMIYAATGAKADFTKLGLKLDDKKTLITCTCTGDYCNRYVGFAKFINTWSAMKQTIAPVTTAPVTTAASTSTTKSKTNQTAPQKPTPDTKIISNLAGKLSFTWAFVSSLFVIYKLIVL